MNDREQRRDSSDRGPRKNSSRSDGGNKRRGNDGPRQNRDRKPRRDGDWKPRGDRREDRDQRGDRGDRRDRDRDRGRDCSSDRDGGQRQDRGRGGTRGGGRSDRGGKAREYTEAERLQHELRPVRSEHDDPAIPRDVKEEDLYGAARNELKTLQPETQERVAKHLAMVLALIDEDPELAHQHAISASRRAGRIPVAREFLAMTAYRIGDYALALRELRTYRRLSGKGAHIALMVECERGLGRPKKAIEVGHEVDPKTLRPEQRAYLAIAMSGARLDLGQTQQALFELETDELNPKKAYSWSPELFGAYSAVLEELGRDVEAREWRQRAAQAEAALAEHHGGHDELEVLEIVEMETADLETGTEADPAG